MTINTAFSTNSSAREAVKEVVRQLEPASPSFVLYFSSSEFEQNIVAEEMKRHFPEIPTAGCSTAGEIIMGRMLQKSLVAMSFGRDTIAECSIQPVYNIHSENHVQFALSQFAKQYSIDLMGAKKESYVGLILIDGLQTAEEKIMESIGNLTNIPFIGGSAGDDLRFEKTWVHCDGKAINDAAVLMLLKPAKGYDIIKTQSFCATNKKLTATKVDKDTRTVFEFDYKPATTAYAEALGIPEEDLVEKFMHNPLGLIIEGEMFVRSPQRIAGDSIIFYCAVNEGMEVRLLKSTNIIEDTQKVIAKKIALFGKPAAVINFNCILRTLELDQNGKLDDYERLFSGLPTIGFSTYGEEYIKHINQTATMLLLK